MSIVLNRFNTFVKRNLVIFLGGSGVHIVEGDLVWSPRVQDPLDFFPAIGAFLRAFGRRLAQRS